MYIQGEILLYDEDGSIYIIKIDKINEEGIRYKFLDGLFKGLTYFDEFWRFKQNIRKFEL